MNVLLTKTFDGEKKSKLAVKKVTSLQLFAVNVNVFFLWKIRMKLGWVPNQSYMVFGHV